MSSTNGGFEFFSPENTNWVFQEVREATWTAEENKRFEKALAFHDDKDNPESWLKIAASIPGKTVSDVIRRYKELEDDVSDIEAGLIPIPGYGGDASSETTGSYFYGLENSGCRYGYDYVGGGKRSSPPTTGGFRLPMPEKERKKGVPWTEEEHRRFLMGLKKYGKGDWRNIARNFVTTRTPTQVASHAQKYFIRQLTDCKDKRRSSIHDITTVNVPDAKHPQPPLQHSLLLQLILLTFSFLQSLITVSRLRLHLRLPLVIITCFRSGVKNHIEEILEFVSSIVISTYMNL